ncbi:hypothetical protein Mesau_05656 [Mesorhizobium australicum WSM2073]|uniref:Uncharacterized protein n=3 Tax=Mesorhizobium TaxID=68287 RepID=L0KTD8_MESAW|nr:hypothetical protein Mesci_5604 [Mesorhizobium ciceri biovar biserrulae WSM1271]AEH90583.1 hypothetical protein Mesop_6187 [Mesorhizobium opportunistum WSM2075]AGB47955.1 hypothetical protein Mesau_05656 [Mesorhizobium australicum WSM2073]
MPHSSGQLRTPCPLGAEPVSSPALLTMPGTSPATCASPRREPAARRTSSLEPLVNEHKAGAIPDQNLDPVSPFGPEDEGRPRSRGRGLASPAQPMPIRPWRAGSQPAGSPRRSSVRRPCNHREARTARITCDSCSRSTVVRITMSSITISTLALAPIRWPHRPLRRRRFVHHQRREHRRHAFCSASCP